ncbi:MAG: hypothetical protein NTY19_21070 [Planctomycetota bacterium]|nr:hypothetical protein [Planctomycetota bacterium]
MKCCFTLLTALLLTPLAASADPSPPLSVVEATGLRLGQEGINEFEAFDYESLRYWSPIGRQEINPVCRADAEENAAFRLTIDGVAASNRWTVVKIAAEPTATAGGERAEVVLRHAEP